MRVKPPVQPLVFCYEEATALCGAVARIYKFFPNLPARLSLYRGRYYLALFAKLPERLEIKRLAAEYGSFAGPAPVLYAFTAEHGQEISGNAIKELGEALVN